jgi:isopenicillin N synthase-like dioxygenase
MIFYEPARTPDHIPVIDLSPSLGFDPVGQDEVARQIHKACRETGFFYVSHHGLPQALIDAQFDWAARFFALPLEQKLAIHMKNSPSASGYEPIGGQTLDSQDATADMAPPDLKEGYYCGMEQAGSAPDASATATLAANQWPAGLPGFRDQMLGYTVAVRRVADHVVRLLARSLDLPAGWFDPFFAKPTMTLRLIKYPPHPADALDNQLGAGAHTDWGGITLLAQDDAGGLEVRNADGHWIQAPPIPGTIVVNLGDLVARWTNGVYASNMHRVRNKSSSAARYSMPFFFGPQPDSVIEPIPGCAGADRPRLFATCTAAEHMNEMFRRSYGFSATADAGSV